MNGAMRWRDSGHLERAVATAGGQEAFDAAVSAMLDDVRGLAAGRGRKRRDPSLDGMQHLLAGARWGADRPPWHNARHGQFVRPACGAGSHPWQPEMRETPPETISIFVLLDVSQRS